MVRGLLLVALAGCQLVFKLDAPDAAVDPGCPSSYLINTGSGTYRYEQAPKTMAEAQTICRLEGELAMTRPTHLVVLSDENERDNVHVLVNANEIWIGLTDSVAEDQYHWVTSEDPAFGRIGGIEPWGAGEPSNSGGDEDCVEMRGDSLFNDLRCTDSKPFVCECDEFPSVPPFDQ